MLKANPKKTKSAPNTGRTLVLTIVATIVLAPMLLLAIRLVASNFNSTPLVLDSVTYRLEIVTTKQAQQQGLSGRESLKPHTGMLFSYSAELDRCFWMKDMQFPIDIIWVNADKRVTRLEAEVSPETYPKSFCAPAQYVIELPAGDAARRDVAVDQTLRF